MQKKPKVKEDEAKAASEAAVASEGTELEAQIRAAEEEAKTHYDKLLRVMAEFENFKKRMSREKEDFFRYSNEKLLTDLLPALDDLDRVLDHVPPDASDDVKKIADGVELVKKALTVTLERYSLKEVPSLGEKFDPVMHEAIATIDSDAHDPDTIVAVHRKGYWLSDRLLRPATVTVAKSRQATPDDGESEQAPS